MSSKWFCNSCHSLNARGAKRCYSCGAREDYLGLDALTGVPAEVKPEQLAPAGRGSAGDAIATLASTKGSIEFANAGQGALPRGRTRPKNVAAIVVSALVLVAVIVAAAVVGIGRGSTVGPAASSTPSATPDSAAPSAVAAASPASSGHPTKPGVTGVSGAPASPPASAPPSVAPLPTATPLDDKPLPSAPATLAATPFPLGSALPPDQLAAAHEHLVRSTSFSGHMDVRCTTSSAASTERQPAMWTSSPRVPVRVDLNLQATRRQNGHLQKFAIVGSFPYSQVGAGVTIEPPALGSGPAA